MHSVQSALLKMPLTVRYGLLLACGLVSLAILEHSFYSHRFSLELYTGLVGLLFLTAGVGIGVGIARSVRTSRRARNSAHVLSSRELQIVRRVGAGMTNQEVAADLYVSVNTVKTHLKNIFRKLEVANRVQAIARVNQLNIS